MSSGSSSISLTTSISRIDETVGILARGSGCEVDLGLIVVKGSSSGSDSKTLVLDLVREGLGGTSRPLDALALGRDDFLGTSSLSLAFVFDLERNVFFWISPSALLSSGSDLATDFDLDLTFMGCDESESSWVFVGRRISWCLDFDADRVGGLDFEGSFVD